MLSQYFQKVLSEKIDRYSNEKFFFYNQKFHNNHRPHNKNDCYDDHYICFEFFEEFFHYLDNDIRENPYNEEIEYIPNKTFNYYLLIKESFYKTFKKMDLYLEAKYVYDNRWNNDFVYKIFQDTAKFIKGTYSKKKIHHNGVNYISLKLRALRNTFIPEICLTFDDKNLKCDKGDTNILIMAKPVKKKYLNMVTLGCNIETSFKDEIKITSKLTLKYNHSKSKYYSEENRSIERIESILEDYDEKKYYDKYYNNIDAILYNEKTGNSIDIELIEVYNKN